MAEQVFAGGPPRLRLLERVCDRVVHYVDNGRIVGVEEFMLEVCHGRVGTPLVNLFYVTGPLSL